MTSAFKALRQAIEVLAGNTTTEAGRAAAAAAAYAALNEIEASVKPAPALKLATRKPK